MTVAGVGASGGLVGCGTCCLITADREPCNRLPSVMMVAGDGEVGGLVGRVYLLPHYRLPFTV